MFTMGFPGNFKRCDMCGVSVARDSLDKHRCSPSAVAERKIPEVLAEFERYLASKHGKFDLYYAQRERLRG